MSDTYRWRGWFYIDQERLVFRRLGVGIADKGRERVRPPVFSRHAGETPMQRDSHDVNGFAVTDERSDALGDNGLRLDRTAFRPDAHPTAQFDAFLPGELFRDFDK